jgi:hypothetical protein
MVLEIFDYFLLAPFRFGASRGNGGMRGKSRKEKRPGAYPPRKGWNRGERLERLIRLRFDAMQGSGVERGGFRSFPIDRSIFLFFNPDLVGFGRISSETKRLPSRFLMFL